MKKLSYSSFILLFSFCFLPHEAHTKEVKIAADPWCPFTCKQDNELKGILIEVAERAFQTEYRVTYTEINWSRAIEDTRKGNFHAIAGALKDDAPDFIFTKHSVANQKSCFYVKKENDWKYRGRKSLHGMRIGAVADYSYGQEIDSFLKDKSAKVDFVSGTETVSKLVKKLGSGRNDVIIEDESVMNFYLKNHTEVALQNAGCIQKLPLYVAFSPANKESKELAEKLDRAIEQMRKDGSLKKILSKYQK